jgi:hypothetical protein
VILNSMETKLGYMNAKESKLVFPGEGDLTIGKVIIDRLTKVKGKKVRKELIDIAAEVLARMKDKRFREVEIGKMMIMQGTYSGVLGIMLECSDVLGLINTDGVLERILYSID